MRVDASQVLAQGGVKTKQGTDALTESVKNGAATGAVSGDGAEEDLSLGRPSLMRGFSDMSLGPYAAKLAELNMPVTEESARAMRDLMAQHPKLSMDEAAFLASNKITGDESLMKAALEVMSGGDKTSAMIAKVISTLVGEQEFLVNQDLGTHKPKNSVEGSKIPGNFEAKPDNFQVGSSGRAPLSELIAAVVKSANGVLAAAAGTENAQVQGKEVQSQFAQQIIPQTDSNMQTNTQKIIENLQNSPQIVTETAGDGSSRSISVTILPSAETEVKAVPQGTTETAPQVNAKNDNPASPAATQEPSASTTAQSEAKTVQATVAGLLSDIPEFKGTPQTALDKFSNMLLRIARDAGFAAEGNPALKEIEQLAAQLDKMFTKIDRKDADAGMRLREAREELFARLTLVQEEIARASQPMREQLLSQTQKLIDHVRFLNNIEQFAYMQLPVQLHEDKRATAELYVFKRKGGKKADPDNVNILLAIDLEYMGHWEALLNIKGKDVYLNMEVAGEAEKEHFGSNTVLLHELLSEAGFKLINTNIKISQEETTPLTALSAFDRYSGRKLGSIDFKI